MLRRMPRRVALTPSPAGLVPGRLVPVGDRGSPPTDRRGLTALPRQVTQIRCDDALVRRQGTGSAGGTPSGEVGPIGGVSPPGGGGLLRLQEPSGLLDLSGSERAGQDGVGGDQVVHGGPGVPETEATASTTIVA
jgi:hypothetical protein